MIYAVHFYGVVTIALVRADHLYLYRNLRLPIFSASEKRKAQQCRFAIKILPQALACERGKATE